MLGYTADAGLGLHCFQSTQPLVIPGAVLILRKFDDMIRQVPELKIGNSVAAEIFQQLTAV